MTTDFWPRWYDAADRIESDYAKLTPAQRRTRSRSARIEEIKASHTALNLLGQITIARLGITREDILPGGAWRALFESEQPMLAAYSDRMRRLGSVGLRQPHRNEWRIARQKSMAVDAR